MPNSRIALLDSFRFIAIAFVLIYHLTNPWVAKYPHHDFFLHIFKYGYLGVYFFFMISGFVICSSLKNTPTIGVFFRKRFARLFPAMLLCTVLTFFIAHLAVDKNQFADSRELKNFLPSLTFINPRLWTQLTGINFSWINGSYWSLWVEVQFYIIAASVYFWNKFNFRRNIFIVGIGIALSKYIPIQIINHFAASLPEGVKASLETWRFYNEIFNITFCINWFLCGAAFQYLYTGLKDKKSLINVLWLGVISLCLVKDLNDYYHDKFMEMVIAGFIMFALFLLLIYYDRALSFLENRLICRVGLISYSIYLIHEQIGILLINKYSSYLGKWSGLSPFIVIVMVTLYGELSYRFYENKAAKILSR